MVLVLNNLQSRLSNFYTSLKQNGWMTIAYSFVAHLLFLVVAFLFSLVLGTNFSLPLLMSGGILIAISFTYASGLLLISLLFFAIISIFFSWFVYSATLNTYKNYLATGERGSYIQNGFKGMRKVLSGLSGYIIIFYFFVFSMRFIVFGLNEHFQNQFTTLSTIIFVILVAFIHSYCLPYVAVRMFTKKYFKPHSSFIKRNFLIVIIFTVIFLIVSYLPFASILETVIGYLYLFYVMYYYANTEQIENN
jgi:hypothetical protein